MIKVARGNKGFTLIELLIVVAIIGILAAVAIPAYTGYTQKARMTEAVNAMGAVKTAVAARFTENGGSFTAPSSVVCHGVGQAAGECGLILGLTIPAARLSDIEVVAAGTITGTLTGIGTPVDTTTITLTNAAGDGVAWAWGGTVPVAFRPAS